MTSGANDCTLLSNAVSTRLEAPPRAARTACASGGYCPPYRPVSQSITRSMALEQTGQKRSMLRVNMMQSVVGR